MNIALQTALIAAVTASLVAPLINHWIKGGSERKAMKIHLAAEERRLSFMMAAYLANFSVSVIQNHFIQTMRSKGLGKIKELNEEQSRETNFLRESTKAFNQYKGEYLKNVNQFGLISKQTSSFQDLLSKIEKYGHLNFEFKGDTILSLMNERDEIKKSIIGQITKDLPELCDQIHREMKKHL